MSHTDNTGTSYTTGDGKPATHGQQVMSGGKPATMNSGYVTF